MGRAPCCDKTTVKRGPWSPEEDAALKSFIEKHGTGGNWISLPQKAGLNRCGKSCRLRWLNYLRPGIKHGGFTDEEDSIIVSLYNLIGSRWATIAANLQGRTDNDVKNHWNGKLKKKLLAINESESAATSPPVMKMMMNSGFSAFQPPPPPAAAACKLGYYNAGGEGGYFDWTFGGKNDDFLVTTASFGSFTGLLDMTIDGFNVEEEATNFASYARFGIQL